MPFAHKYRFAMRIPEPGGTIGPFLVEDSEVGHVGAGDGRYDYPVSLVLVGAGGKQAVRNAVREYLRRGRTTFSGYGNPYQLTFGRFEVESLEGNRYRVTAKGTGVRIDLERELLRFVEYSRLRGGPPAPTSLRPTSPTTRKTSGASVPRSSAEPMANIPNDDVRIAETLLASSTRWWFGNSMAKAFRVCVYRRRSRTPPTRSNTSGRTTSTITRRASSGSASTSSPWDEATTRSSRGGSSDDGHESRRQRSSPSLRAGSAVIRITADLDVVSRPVHHRTPSFHVRLQPIYRPGAITAKKAPESYRSERVERMEMTIPRRKATP
jgi:hypothetical protein